MKAFLNATFVYFGDGMYELCFVSVCEHKGVVHGAAAQYRALACIYSASETCDVLRG
jgi:hypothetical protein